MKDIRAVRVELKEKKKFLFFKYETTVKIFYKLEVKYNDDWVLIEVVNKKEYI